MDNHNRPVFIEAVTYRLGDHTTADDARRYRDDEEVALWQSRDPLKRVRALLEAKGMWSDAQQIELDEHAKATVTAAVERAESIDAPSLDDIFNWTFADIPEQIATQRDTMRTSSIGQDPSQIASEQATTKA